MKILIDLLHIRSFSYAGIYIAAIDIVKGLLKYSNYNLTLLIWEDQEEYLDKWIGQSLCKIFVPLEQKDYLSRRFTVKTPPKGLLDIIDSRNFDFVFTTFYSIDSYVFPYRFNQVGLIYDMQVFRKGWYGGRKRYALYWLFFSIIYYRNLRHIVTISKYTTNEIKRFSGRNSTPIYLNIEKSLDSVNEEKIQEIEGKKYILDVNSFEPYKNTERLIQAYATIEKTIPHILYLKGYCNAYDKYRLGELLELSKKLGIENRVIFDVNNRNQAEMAYLFSHADLFVSPSLMEGFGLTPIEAITHNCPTIVSNIETLIEVTDGKVKTFNPKSVESIAETILDVLNNPLSMEERLALSSYFIGKYSLKNEIESYINYFNNLR